MLGYEAQASFQLGSMPGLLHGRYGGKVPLRRARSPCPVSGRAFRVLDWLPRRFVPLLRTLEGQISDVKVLFGFVGILMFIEAGVGQVKAEFTSLYVFGDGLCSTTDPNAAGPPLFYGNRYCNGRVWVEVLSQWQGLSYDPNKNWSYFGQISSDLVANVAALDPVPEDVASALFVVWANNADFVVQVSENPPPFNAGAWAVFINQSLANHFIAVTNLYAKGVRTLVMPNASDITSAPFFGFSASDASFVRARVVEFNTGFDTLTSNLVGSLPGLTLHVPDSLALFDDLLANPAEYGITNTTSYAIFDYYPPALAGPGADYLFWDDTHPTAKVQKHLADLVQQMLSPMLINSITSANGTNELGMVNVPAGEAGEVEGGTNFVDWTSIHSFTNTTTSGTVAIPESGPMEFYRVLFPLDWTWP